MAVERGLLSHCVTTVRMAERLGLGENVCDPLRQMFTRWDARGVPGGVGGEQIAPLVRLFHLADAIEVHHRSNGSTPRSARRPAHRPRYSRCSTGCWTLNPVDL